MPDEWIVRVQGKEYGPVDLEELLAWRQDGRLIRENEVREAGSERWFPAADLPEVFADDPATSAPPPFVRRRTFWELIRGSWRAYRRGFGRFFVLALLVSTPSFFLQLVAPFLELPANNGSFTPMILSVVVAFVMLMLLIIAWPFSLAGMQLLAAELLAKRDPKLGYILTLAKPLWTRMFVLGLIVYGSYLFWTVLPLLLAATLATAGTAGAVLIVLLLLIFTTYMVARLFVNFLFWQPAGAIGRGDAMEALRESKEMARSGNERPRIERPVYRGAIIASVWLVVIIVVDMGVELPAMLWRLRGVTSVEQALPLIQAMATSNSLDLPSILTTLAGSLANALLRGWLAAFFVFLYLDTKAGPGAP